MSGPRERRTFAVLGIAGAGLVLGHWVAYALETPHAHDRGELLRATGHGYLPYLTQMALLAAAIGLAGLFLVRLRRRDGTGSFARDVTLLGAAQAGAFVGMEIGERLLSGAPLHDLTHGPLLAIGLVVQLAVAVAGAAVLRLTERAADAAAGLHDLGAPPVSPAPIVAMPVAASRPPARPWLCTVASRAPPSPA